MDSDFSIAIENAKALLESIGKEICNQQEIEVNSTASINAVIKKAFYAIGYDTNNSVVQISTALATIGQQFGEIRNQIGATSHGKTLKEIEERNQLIDEIAKDLLIDSTIVISSFLGSVILSATSG